MKTGLFGLLLITCDDFKRLAKVNLSYCVTRLYIEFVCSYIAIKMFGVRYSLLPIFFPRALIPIAFAILKEPASLFIRASSIDILVLESPT